MPEVGETGYSQTTPLDLSIIIVNWNTKELLLDCLFAVYHMIRDLTFEVFVVDNASADGSVFEVRQQYPQAIIIENERNLGFAAANNKALRIMRGRYAMLLNTDAILTEGAVRRLFQFMECSPEVAMCCGQLLNADGTKQNSIANFPGFSTLLANETLLRILMPKMFPSKHREYATPIPVESCIGACLMVRKAAMDEVGLLDERYFFFMEETDWAFAMSRSGWRSYFVPDARIYHLQGQSAGHNVKARIMFYRARYQYFRKWFPHFWLLCVLLVMVRLLINVLLNGVGLIATLGLHRNIRGRFMLYLQLLFWHLQGCP